jgi:predicted ATP-binding protein involved in virulence
VEYPRNGIHLHGSLAKNLEDFLFLLKCGILRLRDVTLTKLNSYTPFSIAEASSGEQAVVISILGIASKISNNSVICIDEPEICLHPEWQERYIKILTSTFSMYSNCHFIIATHSPQIVSNLEPENSYILSLETGTTNNASEYIRHSSDFQLANVFNSPGFKNEFLTRIALNIFAKVSKNKTFDDEDISNYELLENQSRLLSHDDPVFQLFNALTEMHQKYG